MDWEESRNAEKSTNGQFDSTKSKDSLKPDKPDTSFRFTFRNRIDGISYFIAKLASKDTTPP